jgi:hypothetical protein
VDAAPVHDLRANTSASSFTCWRTTNVLHTLALPGEIAAWSLRILREKVVKIGAKVVAHGRLVFQMAEVVVPGLFSGCARSDRRGAPACRGRS